MIRCYDIVVAGGSNIVRVTGLGPLNLDRDEATPHMGGMVHEIELRLKSDGGATLYGFRHLHGQCVVVEGSQPTSEVGAEMLAMLRENVRGE